MKKSLLPLLFVLWIKAGNIHAQPVCEDPATSVSSAPGNVAWGSTGNALVSDGAFATSAVNDGETTEQLQLTNFGIVAGDFPCVASCLTIDGITASITRKGASSKIKDHTIQLMRGGFVVGSNQAKPANWGNTIETGTYGGAADLWGTTWSMADVTGVNFGILIRAQKSSAGGGAVTASVDFARLCISYTCCLPINLLSFSGTLKNQEAELKWSVGTIEDLELFEIEKSADAKNFSKVGFIKPENKTTGGQSFTFNDKDLSGSTVVYYRLRMNETSGAIGYSKVISVFNESSSAFEVSRIYPNPTESNTATVDLFIPENGTVEILLYSQTGQLVKEQKINLEQGSNKLEVDVTGLAAGVYNYSIGYKNEKKSGKLVRLSGTTREMKEKMEEKKEEKEEKKEKEEKEKEEKKR